MDNSLVDRQPDANTETLRFEYSEVCQFLRHTTQLRRDIVVFVMAVQGSVITIIGNALPDKFVIRDTLLSVVAFLVGLMGILYDVRFVNRMIWYNKRGRQIEEACGMSLFGSADTGKQKLIARITGTKIVRTFFFVICLFWMYVWIMNMVS